MTTSGEPPIQLQNVNHWFGSGEARIQVICDASLSIERGTLTVLRGPSGKRGEPADAAPPARLHLSGP